MQLSMSLCCFNPLLPDDAIWHHRTLSALVPIMLCYLYKKCNMYLYATAKYKQYKVSQIAKFMGPTWGPPGSCRPQKGPMLAPWTLLSGVGYNMGSADPFLTDGAWWIGQDTRHSNGCGVVWDSEAWHTVYEATCPDASAQRHVCMSAPYKNNIYTPVLGVIIPCSESACCCARCVMPYG